MSELKNNEIEVLKKDLAQSDFARRNLQGSIIETTEELKRENTQLQNQILQLINDKNELSKKNRDLHNK